MLLVIESELFIPKASPITPPNYCPNFAFSLFLTLILIPIPFLQKVIYG